MKNNDNKNLLFGVIGDPAAQSKSPAMHNAAFAELGLPAKYEAFLVKEKDLDTFMARLRNGEIKGINVTVPHKQNVIPLLDKISPLAKEIGAVNTIVSHNGILYGDNTDAHGFLDSLLTETSFKISGKSVLILGAGGACRAIAYILSTKNPASISIANRNSDRAQAMINTFSPLSKNTQWRTTNFPNIEPELLKKADLLINTTSMGLAGNPWSNLDFVKQLSNTTLVADIVYAPRETELLKVCKSNGLSILHGDGMLLYQAVRAFEIFTGVNAPVETMRAALTQALLSSEKKS